MARAVCVRVSVVKTLASMVRRQQTTIVHKRTLLGASANDLYQAMQSAVWLSYVRVERMTDWRPGVDEIGIDS